MTEQNNDYNWTEFRAIEEVAPAPAYLNDQALRGLVRDIERTHFRRTAREWAANVTAGDTPQEWTVDVTAGDAGVEGTGPADAAFAAGDFFRVRNREEGVGNGIYVPRPLIKWAGGKQRLMPEIVKRLPGGIGKLDGRITKYVEPFLGGGSVFIEMLHHPFSDRIVSDINPALINMYQTVKEATDRVFSRLYELERAWNDLDTEEERRACYNGVRDSFNTYNPQSDMGSPEWAAAFIFLNKTCYNGLYRVNSRGLFNVPMGTNTHLDFRAGEYMGFRYAVRNVRFECRDYMECLDDIDSHTFVYIDPPYRQLPGKNSFTGYTPNAFTDVDQEGVARFCDLITDKGAKFLLSNSDTGDGYFERLYERFTIEHIKAPRSISRDGATRVKTGEILVRNY